MEQPCLSRNNETYSDVHRVPDIPVQPDDYEPFCRRDRSRSASANQRESPECGVNVYRDSDHDNSDRRPPSRGGIYRHRVLPKPPRYIAGNHARYEYREDGRLQQRADRFRNTRHGLLPIVEAESLPTIVSAVLAFRACERFPPYS